MYKEELIYQLKSQNITHEVENDIIGEFISENLNLIYAMAREQCLSTDDYYDCVQLSYDALQDAVKAYSPGKYSFLSYFRRAFKHKIYFYNLEFKYPMRIKSPCHASEFSFEFIEMEKVAESEYLNDTYYEYSNSCFIAEQGLLRDTIIKILQSELNDKQFRVIVSVFWENMTKKQIAERLQMPYATVRSIYYKSLSVLRRNWDLQRIAIDMYGIHV